MVTLALTPASFLLLRAQHPTMPQLSVDRALERDLTNCLNAPKGYVVCMTDVMTSSVATYGGLGVVKAYLDLVDSNERFKQSCHDALHVIGESMGVYLPDHVKDFIPYSAQCGYSITHEVTTSLPLGKTAATGMTAITKLCGNFPSGDVFHQEACFHGGGHALVAAFGESDAAQGCNLASSGVPADSCRYGVAMRSVERMLSEEVHLRYEPTSDGWRKFIESCAGSNEPMKMACVTLEAEKAVFLQAEYTESFNHFCATEYATAAMGCGIQYGVSLTATSQKIDDLSPFIATCEDDSTSAQFRRGCLVGLPSGLIARGETVDKALSMLCAVVAAGKCEETTSWVRGSYATTPVSKD